MKLPRKREHIKAWLRMIKLGRQAGIIADSQLGRFFPQCKSFSYNAIVPTGQGIVGDFRLSINDRSISDNGLSTTQPAHYAHNEPLPFASEIKLEKYATGQSLANNNWLMTFDYGEYGQSQMAGGRNETKSVASNSYDVNGKFMPPLPPHWEYPDDIQKEFQQTSESIVSNEISLGGPFDTLLIAYDWSEFDGVDLDTRTEITSPPRGVVVGWGRASADGAYLSWAGDDTSASGSEEITVNFQQLATDYPDVSAFTVSLSAFWYQSTGSTGQVRLRLLPFLNGNPLAEQSKVVTISTEESSNIDGEHVGTISYDATTRLATLS
ncbi:hypothetical protein [Cerasicoccus frondis]|uniref:hypothetical protein n=1 Tax=Cerasicoccus frondis TaxID=490090 RepID=UPI002852DABA|nr:hypothetical protein [Cerasicoccus frondis]